nr:mitochondrial potassium channel ATP-binding subunit-like [Lytechinus pictus]
MLAAFINVQIPLLLGDLVQVVSEFTGGEHAGNYLEAVARPALRLTSAYGIQAVCTCSYIAILSSVGERLASRLRTALFSSLLKQDIAFFDVHHTGELVNRLSADVQDFKSSFKLCVSQGLRGTTQVSHEFDGVLLARSVRLHENTGQYQERVPTICGRGNELDGGTKLNGDRRIAAELYSVTSLASAM